MKTNILFCILFCNLLLSGCIDESVCKVSDRKPLKEYHIALVLPLDAKGQSRWTSVINWALNSINQALVDQEQIIIKPEWYNENDSNIEQLFKNLANRDDVYAIIGPLYSRNAIIAAHQCAVTRKSLLPVLASSELMMREFSRQGFLWCLTENDISQCEILLTRASQKGAKSVSLFACNDNYGDTFMDWFAFQATELGLDIDNLVRYDKASLSEQMESLLRTQTDCIICIPSDTLDTRQMINCRNRVSNANPFLLFSDVAFLTEPDETLEGMEGIAQTHDPESGFNTAYKVHYGKELEFGCAHFYDAVLLTGLAVLDAHLTETTDINASLRRIVDGNGEDMNGCSEEAIYQIVKQMKRGVYPRLSGASGQLRFDRTVYTNVIHSVYCHWIIYNGKYLILEYNTSDGSRRTNAFAANWNWKATRMQNFSQESELKYPEQKGLYALIVASSSGWENYRHQADAYAFYQLLQENGLDDDHILLIAEDDIAFNSRNPQQGVVMVTQQGENVYDNICIDYNPSKLTIEGLKALLYGEGVGAFCSGNTDNLIVYWVGHGEPQGLKWLEKLVPVNVVAEMFSEMAKENRFRKLLFILETCYAGRVGECCKEIPGLLCLTAANGDETSKVSNHSEYLHTWLSNSFTDALFEQLLQNDSQSLYKLYNKVYNRTIGSHVSVYNAEYFDNLYNSSINEFIYTPH